VAMRNAIVDCCFLLSFKSSAGTTMFTSGVACRRIQFSKIMNICS
jgi:hypothetical protein